MIAIAYERGEEDSGDCLGRGWRSAAAHSSKPSILKQRRGYFAVKEGKSIARWIASARFSPSSKISVFGVCTRKT